MKKVIYFILLYLFLPFNSFLDLVAILLFFIIFNENEWFAIIFSFFSGLLIDLYNPAYLGLNAFIYAVLAQLLLYIKRYVAKDLITIILTYVIFYMIKIVIINMVTVTQLKLSAFVLTLLLFLPIYLSFSRVFFNTWMKH